LKILKIKFPVLFYCSNPKQQKIFDFLSSGSKASETKENILFSGYSEIAAQFPKPLKITTIYQD